MTTSIKRMKHVLLDLRHVRFVASSGLRTLIKIHMSVNERGGEVLFLHPDEEIWEVLEVAGLVPLIAIVREEEDAYARWGINPSNLPEPEVYETP